MFSEHWSLFLVSLLSYFELSLCGGRLSLRFIDFDNPGSRAHDGHCCDNISICLSNCDVSLRICLALKSDASICSLVNIDTPRLGNDSFTFGRSLGKGHANPLEHLFNQWSEHFKVRITVMDEDGGNLIGRKADLISENVFEVTRSPDTNSKLAVLTSMVLRGYRSVLNLEYKIYCDKGYFKPACLEYCRTTNDSTGHYTCDFENSRRICMQNWYGPRCNHFCKARNDSFGHYKCDLNGNKVCLVNWYGAECNKRCVAYYDASGRYSCSSSNKAATISHVVKPSISRQATYSQKSTTTTHLLTAAPASLRTKDQTATSKTPSAVVDKLLSTQYMKNADILLKTQTSSSLIVEQRKVTVSRNPERTSKYSAGNATHSFNSSQEVPRSDQQKPKETSKFQLMACIAGPLLVIVLLLLAATRCKKTVRKNSQKVKKIKIYPAMSSPEMVHLLESTRISSPQDNDIPPVRKP